MSKENKITAYKGFNRDMTCNGFQYEIGKEYEMPEDEVQICQAGFHACESPLEVLDHYFMDGNCDMARFAEVEQSGKISMEDDGSTKMASSKIRIKAELKFSDLVKIGIDWLIEKTKPVVGKKGRNNDGGENSAKIGSSGDSFVMKNIYGEPISHIEVVMDSWEEGTSGKVYRSIGHGWTWCEVPFKGFEDVLGAINSILEPEALVNAAKYIATASNMNSERKNDVQVVAVTNTLDVMKSNMKKQTISILENTLKRLKSET